MQQVTVLGATGSIGVNTLDVIARHPTKFAVFAITANRNVSLFLQQIQQTKPRYAVLATAPENSDITRQVKQISPETELLIGSDALQMVSSHDDVDVVMAAIVGAAGLMPTMAAASAGKKVLLANKEALVIAGDLLMAQVKASGAVLLPIDSEHNAIFQCLPNQYESQPFAKTGVRKVLLTGSGGPFRTLALDKFATITPEQACNHPNWDMGQKISVDSATMMNKGLEVIEACHLFGINVDQLDVVLHPQSIIHSMVSYVDGSVIAQMGQPDMRTPIAYGLAWPERIDAGVEPLDFTEVSQLDFSKPDLTRYPCLALAFAAFEAGKSMPAILNAANEVSVDAFLNRRIAFTDIAAVNEAVMNKMNAQRCTSIEALLEQDTAARAEANQLCAQLG